MRFFSLLFAVLLIAGCGGDTPDEGVTADRSAPETTASTSAELIDGVQVVEIEAGTSGFSPESVQLKAGVPARFLFTRTTDAGCVDHVSMPELGVDKTPLPLHEETAVEFTPDEAGEFRFVCGMDMQSGTVVVST